MEKTTYLDPFHYIYVEDFYSEGELELIWEELKFLSRPGKLQSPEVTGSAHDEQGKPLKRNAGLWLDQVYSGGRHISNILSVNRKLFSSGVLDSSESWFFNDKVIYKDYTQISYYQDGDGYGTHKDKASITALTWFFREPREFEGGDLIFPNHGVTIPVRNNCTIIFPSQMPHEVSTVVAPNLNFGGGRYCMSQFCHFS